MAYEMQFQPVLSYAPDLIEGTVTTLVLASQSIVLGVILGGLGAIGRTEGPSWLSIALSTYVEVFRNTPLLVQLFLVFFALPMIGLQVPVMAAAVIAMALNLGAYATEIIRAGIVAIPKAQIEAGLSLGLSRFQIIRHIIFIPALMIVYPALTSQLTLTLLGTSIASAISAAELSSAASVIESKTFRSLETYITIALIYIGLTFLFRFLYWIIGKTLFHRKVVTSKTVVEDPLLTGAGA
jgi:polar amino acid transport system permease protein